MTTENSLTTSVGAALTRLRRDRGLSQSALAQRAHISPSTLSRWERDAHLPSLTELDAVFLALGADDNEKAAVLERMSAPRSLRRLRETRSGSLPPNSGDLLLALRQRKGWTQARTARAVGVSQPQIARWERSESWPDTTRLHELCFHLGAHHDETVALTVGDKRLQLSLTPPELRRGAFDFDAWRAYIDQQVYNPTPLMELSLLTAERDILDIAKRDPRAYGMLSDVYSAHARNHLYWQRTRQAADWAARALALTRRYGIHNRENSPWFTNVITLATHAARGERTDGLRRAIALLDQYLPAVFSAPTYYFWGLSLQAQYLAALGAADAAIALGKEACEQTHETFKYDYYFRVLDYAQLLLRLNRPASAWDALQGIAEHEAISLQATVRRQLLEAESLFALRKPAAAQTRLHTTAPLVRRLALPDLNDRWQRLTSRC